jgi:hypothetical protein
LVFAYKFSCDVADPRGAAELGASLPNGEGELLPNERGAVTYCGVFASIIIQMIDPGSRLGSYRFRRNCSSLRGWVSPGNIGFLLSEHPEIVDDVFLLLHLSARLCGKFRHLDVAFAADVIHSILD